MVQAFGKKHLAILELTLFNLLVFIYLFIFLSQPHSINFVVLP